MRKVKIVCTLGPSTSGVNRLVELMRAGMDVARLNFSHGDHEFHRKMYADVREAARQVGKPVAILADLSGPKIRVGEMQGGVVQLEKGKQIVLHAKGGLGTAERIPHTYVPLARDVRPGDPILLDDGLLELRVDSVQGDEVLCTVVAGGGLKNKKGMNLPGSPLSTPAVTEKDAKDIAFGRELGVDYFALSFVRSPEDVRQAKALAGDTPVIAKVEKPEAVRRLNEVLEASDGVMVARGDLGVESGHEKVPLIQKRILRDVKPLAKAVITATQMLDSMVHNPVPTRAEVSDVANAVLDGTDAVMLSAETSVGAYPVQAVQTLARIIHEIESNPDCNLVTRDVAAVTERTFSNAVADATASVAAHLGLKAIAVYTESGHSAVLMSAHRPQAELIAFSRHERVLNRLALFWGIHPVHGDWVHGVKGVVDQAERKLLADGIVQPGDAIAVTFGMVLDDEEFQTDVMKLWRVRGKRLSL